MKSLSQKTNNSTLIPPESAPNCQLSRLHDLEGYGDCFAVGGAQSLEKNQVFDNDNQSHYHQNGF